MRRQGNVNASQFVDDMIKIIPKEVVPPLSSPVTKFFRDLMAWNQNMWQNSTDGLNVVAKAIETGSFDQQEYNRL